MRLAPLHVLVVLALAACATPSPDPAPVIPQPVIAAPVPQPAPEMPLVLQSPPLLTPFAPAAMAELEALPMPAPDLWDRIVDGYAIPDVDDAALVAHWEQYYASRPDYVARMVERSRRYLYHIVTAVQSRGMPLDLALLPMVESAFNPNALSTSRASGIWQFVPSTGKTYGLQQNFWFDSRRDIVAATDSALDYLDSLYTRFGDWQLALAAYNWGEGNVQRAVDRNRQKGLPVDFASLTNVPAETRNYLPKLQAVKNIIRDPGKYGLVIDDIPDAPYFAVVKTTRRMDVKRAAELAEMPLDEFEMLNPQHNRPVIAGADEYTILLPIDKAEVFAAKLELTNQPLVSWQAYRLRANESLPQVAARYGMSTETLRAVNGIGARAHVPVGHALLVPAERPTEASALSLSQTVFTTVPQGRTTYYQVRRGDTLSAVAARHHVSTGELRAWNNIVHNKLVVGQHLRINNEAPPATRAAVHHGTRTRAAAARGPAQKAAAPGQKPQTASRPTRARKRVAGAPGKPKNRAVAHRKAPVKTRAAHAKAPVQAAAGSADGG
ncbi:MAG: transglycosylase SLT domain-containing protein [Casimicrobiaceae bacterium]